MRARTTVPFLIFIFIGLIFGTARSVSAQERIAISGRITDASGGAVPGATVDAVVAERRYSTTISGADGSYQVEVPARVPLNLRIALAGFADQTIAMSGQQRNATRDVVLLVAGLSDSLVVTASRTPMTAASVTESVTTFTQQEIAAL